MFVCANKVSLGFNVKHASLKNLLHDLAKTSNFDLKSLNYLVSQGDNIFLSKVVIDKFTRMLFKVIMQILRT